MGYLGDPPETGLGRVLRYVGYFLFGAVLGMVPAAWAVAAVSSPNIAWRIPILIVLGSGCFFCLLGILTGGRLFSALLRLFGRDVDPWGR